MSRYTTQKAHDDITSQFKLFKREGTSRADRMLVADAIIECYFAVNDKIPPVGVLDRLSTLILQDELADKHPDKMSRNEYPLFSDSQADERYKGERSIKAAQDVATDGADYRVRTRDSNRRMREYFG